MTNGSRVRKLFFSNGTSINQSKGSSWPCSSYRGSRQILSRRQHVRSKRYALRIPILRWSKPLRCFLRKHRCKQPDDDELSFRTSLPHFGVISLHLHILLLYVLVTGHVYVVLFRRGSYGRASAVLSVA